MPARSATKSGSARACWSARAGFRMPTFSVWSARGRRQRPRPRRRPRRKRARRRKCGGARARATAAAAVAASAQWRGCAGGHRVFGRSLRLSAAVVAGPTHIFAQTACGPPPSPRLSLFAAAVADPQGSGRACAPACGPYGLRILPQVAPALSVACARCFRRACARALLRRARARARVCASPRWLVPCRCSADCSGAPKRPRGSAAAPPHRA